MPNFAGLWTDKGAGTKAAAAKLNGADVLVEGINELDR